MPLKNKIRDSEKTKYERALELRLRVVEIHLLLLKAQVCEEDAEKVEAALNVLRLDCSLIGPYNLRGRGELLKSTYPEFFEDDGGTGKAQKIELDCPPGDPRPGDLIAGVIKGTGLPLRAPASKWYGCWEWDYSDVPQCIWAETRPVLAKRIMALYRDGVIRAGGW